jgi:hypothetical protein
MTSIFYGFLEEKLNFFNISMYFLKEVTQLMFKGNSHIQTWLVFNL